MLNLQRNAKTHWAVVLLMFSLQWNAKTHSLSQQKSFLRFHHLCKDK